LLVKELGLASVSWLDFFISSGYVISVIGTILIAGSMMYFWVKGKAGA